MRKNSLGLMVGALWVACSSPSPQNSCPDDIQIDVLDGRCYSSETFSNQPQNNLLTGGDLNNDSFFDLILGGEIWLNDGTGHFVLSPQQDALPQLADFNQDNFLDLFSSDGIQLNNGNAQFTTTQPLTFQIPNASGGNLAVSAADLDNDSDQDLVGVTNPDQGVVLLNDGNAQFTQTQLFDFPGNGPTTVALGDFNGDSFADLVVSVFDDADLRLLLNDQTGSLRHVSPL